jgi:hypothetical protein
MPDPTPGAGRVLGPDHPLAVRAAARLALEQRRATAAYGIQGDPWAFVRDCVWTRDEASGMVRRYPNHEYAELLVRRWQAHPLLAIPKSRRMVITWLFVSLNVWLAMFSPLSKVAFMARKLGRTETEGSCELVRRAKFVVEHLPASLPAQEVEYSVGLLRFGNGSEIVALGEGEEQARQHTFSSILADEMAFWEKGLESWIAMRPTVEGGGKITAVSSAGPGFFRDLVHDLLG